MAHFCSYLKMSKWDELKREARIVERALEEKVSSFTSMTKKMGRDPRATDEGTVLGLCEPGMVFHVENPGERSEQGMALEIEQFLSSLLDIIDRMSRENDESTTQEAVLQRYRELHFDLNTEFKRALVSSVDLGSFCHIGQSTMNEKLDAQNLFARKYVVRQEVLWLLYLGREANPSVDSEADAFLKERGMLDASSSMASETLRCVSVVVPN